MQFRFASLARFASVLLLSFILGASAQAQRVMSEDFSTNPATRGWEVFGDSRLFRWNAEQQNLQVTWDSSRSNSFLALPLGMPLNRHQDFSVSLDLTLHEVTPASTPGKPGAMQVAFGFQNQADAQKPAFHRGTGTDSPNLVEFNYFPDTGFGTTVWPVAVATNASVNYNGAEDLGFYELPLDVTLRITLEYNSTNETLSLAVRTNAALVAPIIHARLSTNSSQFSQPFTDFRVDAFAISSYTDIGVEDEFAGSLHARGTIDNIVVTVPEHPVANLRFSMVNGQRGLVFQSHSRYEYFLESTADFRNWTRPNAGVAGTNGDIQLLDSTVPASPQTFYRVLAIQR